MFNRQLCVTEKAGRCLFVWFSLVLGAVVYGLAVLALRLPEGKVLLQSLKRTFGRENVRT